MKLKTATLLAIGGIVLHMVGSLVRWRHAPAIPEGLPLYFRLAIVPAICFPLSLLLFFVALYRKQCTLPAAGNVKQPAVSRSPESARELESIPTGEVAMGGAAPGPSVVPVPKTVAEATAPVAMTPLIPADVVGKPDFVPEPSPALTPNPEPAAVPPSAPVVLPKISRLARASSWCAWITYVPPLALVGIVYGLIALGVISPMPDPPEWSVIPDPRALIAMVWIGFWGGLTLLLSVSAIIRIALSHGKVRGYKQSLWAIGLLWLLPVAAGLVIVLVALLAAGWEMLVNWIY